MQKLISIVIPVYNCEKYIEECLDTILAQTYKNLEIIIINDYSSDNTIKKVKKYLLKDERIKLVNNVGKGVSAARNTGIELAQGEALFFVDADDFLDKEYVNDMVNSLEYADLGICGYKKIEEEKETLIISEVEGKILTNEFLYYALCTKQITSSCWNKVFKQKILKKYNIRFCEEISINEDMLFLLQYLEKSKSIYYIPKTLYSYRRNKKSVMHSIYYDRVFDLKKKSILIALEKMENEIILCNNTELKMYFDYRKVHSSIWLFMQMFLGSHYEREVIKKIQSNCIHGLKSWFFKKHIGSFLERVSAICISISPTFVFFICKNLVCLKK